MIDREQWKRLSALIDEAFALDPAARVPWLQALAERDPAAAARVEEALAAEAETQPATEHVTWAGFARGLESALQPTIALPLQDISGTRLGAWRLVEKIGEGGMGQVWRARRDDGLYAGEAAIKLLRGGLGATPMARRFARERALLARLHHPAITQLLDAGIADASAGVLAGQAYLVLEIAEGESLAVHARRHAPTLAERVRLLLRVADAVEYAHARLIVHRDLKPGNVIVTRAGETKLLDFGIAALLADDDPEMAAGEITRVTGRGMTPAYAAPEQITGAPIGTAADVFALGVMLFELISGTLPYGPRNMPRAELERAVAQGRARRLIEIPPGEAAQDGSGPGLPADAKGARGDLEAIAQKALSRQPQDRYPSVRALIDDLQAWLAWRPVSVRRGHRTHRFRLWLRRNAVLALGIGAVFVSLGLGLAASLWQRERALGAARVSDEVTLYLEELLASASPDQHGGQWPTVLQVLEKSRAELGTRFADSPETRIRILQVLTETYRRLNRLDLAVPLAREWMERSAERHGAEDLRTLTARFELAHSHQLMGQCDLAAGLVEPALPAYRALPAGEELKLQAVSLAGICQARLGRFDEAERTLEEERLLVEALPADDPWRIGYLNHLQALRSAQGRVREALDAINRTQPFWTNPDPAYQREILNLRRNQLVMQVRAAQYDRVEERGAELLAKMDALLGPGSGLALSLRDELARYEMDVGRYPAALRVREEALAAVRGAGVRDPAVLLPLRAQLLQAQAAARAAPPDALRRDAQALFDELEPLAAQMGRPRAEAWLAIARTALAIDDTGLASQVLMRMQADPGLQLAEGPQRDLLLHARKLQLDGQLARLRGDLVASEALLRERLLFLSRGDMARLVPAWAAAVDLAYTLVLAGSPAAAGALADAASRRPAAVPQGHPLDAAVSWLRARLEAGSTDADAARAALAALQQAQRGSASSGGAPAGGPLRGALGGALF